MNNRQIVRLLARAYCNGANESMFQYTGEGGFSDMLARDRNAMRGDQVKEIARLALEELEVVLAPGEIEGILTSDDLWVTPEADERDDDS